MHPKFAERIAKEIHLRKWKFGWKPMQVAKWLADRFPNMTVEDQQQVKQYLPKK